MLIRVKILLLLAVLLLLLSGCSESETEAPAAVPADADMRGQTARDVMAAQGVKGTETTQQQETSAMILPEHPSTTDDLRVVVCGADGRIIYNWQINGQLVVAATSARLDSGLFKKGDQITVTVALGEQQLRAETTIINTPPEVVGVYALPSQVRHGLDVRVTPQGRDVDGDSISYQYLWLINDEEQLFETNATLAGNRFQKGDRLAVVVTPSDDNEEGRPYRSGEIVVGNAAPSFTSTPPQNIESSSYRYAVQATDPDGDPLRYRLDAAPVGMVIDEKTGVTSWEMTPVHAGVNTIRIIVTDTDGAEAVQEFSMNLNYAE